MKMLDNPTKYEVQFEQYLRSILDISDSLHAGFGVREYLGTNFVQDHTINCA